MKSPWITTGDDDDIVDAEEIIRRIHKDILQSNPELKSLQLHKIIEETMEEIAIGSYRDYYSNRHRILVNEVREDAIELHKYRHARCC